MSHHERLQASVMRRIALIFILLCACVLAGCSSVGSSVLLGRDIQFNAPQLQAQLDRKFPRDYRKLGGLVSISLLNPRLELPGGGRLHLEFDMGLSGMGSRSRSPSGVLIAPSSMVRNTTFCSVGTLVNTGTIPSVTGGRI